MQYVSPFHVTETYIAKLYRPAQYPRVRLIPDALRHFRQYRPQIFYVRLYREILPHQRDYSIQRRVETAERALERYELRVAYSLHRLPVTSNFVHAVYRYVVQAHRQDKRLHAPNYRVVIALPPKLQIPLPRFSKHRTPQPERLILRAVLPKLR